METVKTELAWFSKELIGYEGPFSFEQGPLKLLDFLFYLEYDWIKMLILWRQSIQDWESPIEPVWATSH